MSSYNLISADSHVIEPADLFEQRLPVALRERAPKLASVDGGSAWLVEGADPVPLPVSAATGSGYRLSKSGQQPREAVSFEEVLPGFYDPGERVKMQDTDSVDAEVLYPFPGLWDAVKRLEDHELTLACVRAYNDWIAEFSQHNPNRLVGIGKIPSTSSQDAEAELVRCVSELGLKGVVLDTWPGGSPAPGDPNADRFWSTLNEAGVPLSIHYALGADSVTAPPSGIAPGLNPPMANNAMPLIATGLFDRSPNVRIVFAHGNAGWTFHWLEQMDTNYLRRRHLNPSPFANPDSLPSEYVRKHFWFTFHHDRSIVKNRHLIGSTRLMWASSLPLDSSMWPDDSEQASRVTEELPADERHRLLAANVARLYRLPGYEEGFNLDETEQLARLVHY